MTTIRTGNELKKAYPYQFTSRTFKLSRPHGRFATFIGLCQSADQLLKEFGNGTHDANWLQVNAMLGTSCNHTSHIPAFDVLRRFSVKAAGTYAIGDLTLAAWNATCQQCSACRRHIEVKLSSAPRGMQIWGDVQVRNPRACLALHDNFPGWPKWAMANFIQTNEVHGVSNPDVRKRFGLKLTNLFAGKKRGSSK
jgi:hypothetical protein